MNFFIQKIYDFLKFNRTVIDHWAKLIIDKSNQTSSTGFSHVSLYNYVGKSKQKYIARNTSIIRLCYSTTVEDIDNERRY